MVRYLVAAAGVFAMMSSLAMAETTIVTRTTPGYVAPHHKTTVVKRHVNRYGKVVTVKKTHGDGFSGGSVSRSVTDPYSGATRTRTITRE